MGFAYHVNTVSVAPVGSRENQWIDLCTDDLQTAQSWAADTLAYSSDPGQVEPPTESPRFFDFSYRSMSGGTRILRSYKCSYFRPILNNLGPGWNYGSPSDALLGKLTGRLTNEGSREFAEYFWLEQLHQVLGENWLTTNVFGSASTISVDIYNTTLSMETSASAIMLA